MSAPLPAYGEVIGYMVLTDDKDHRVRADWDGKIYARYEEAHAVWSDAMQRLLGDGVYLAELIHVEAAAP